MEYKSAKAGRRWQMQYRNWVLVLTPTNTFVATSKKEEEEEEEDEWMNEWIECSSLLGQWDFS